MAGCSKPATTLIEVLVKKFGRRWWANTEIEQFAPKKPDAKS
jgi:hypothetical protein